MRARGRRSVGLLVSASSSSCTFCCRWLAHVTVIFEFSFRPHNTLSPQDFHDSSSCSPPLALGPPTARQQANNHQTCRCLTSHQTDWSWSPRPLLFCLYAESVNMSALINVYRKTTMQVMLSVLPRRSASCTSRPAASTSVRPP